MTHYSLLIFIVICFGNWSFANHDVKDRHRQQLLNFGDVELTDGDHLYFFRKDTNFPSSIFTHKNSFAYYCESAEDKTYIKCTAQKKDQRIDLQFINKYNKNDVVRTLEYTIHFDISKEMNIRASINEDTTDVRADFTHILGCILQFAPQIFPIILKCKDSSDIVKCVLDVVPPASELLKCILKKNERIAIDHKIPFTFVSPFTEQKFICKRPTNISSNYAVKIISKSMNIENVDLDVNVGNIWITITIKSIMYRDQQNAYIHGKLIFNDNDSQ